MTSTATTAQVRMTPLVGIQPSFKSGVLNPALSQQPWLEHRLSKLRNREWNPPTHPCDHVCCTLPVLRRRNFWLHAYMFRGSVVWLGAPWDQSSI